MTDPHTPTTRTIRHALRPRRTWPWPDLDDTIASAERWTTAGIDLRAPLRRLTWPVIRRHNIGFIAALVQRRIPVPPDVVTSASTAVRKLLEGHADGQAWQRYAEWFTHLTPDLAVTVLQRQALATTRPEHERYRAWAFIDANFPDDSCWVAVELACDPRLPDATRAAIAETLTARDPSATVAVFDQVARRSTAGAIRNQAAGFLEPLAPGKALDRFAETAADEAQDDAVRLAACRRVLARDRHRGVDLLFDLLLNASSDHVRDDVMKVLHREDPKRLKTSLDQLRRQTGRPRTALQSTKFLHEHYGRDRQIVVDLASNEAFPADIRFEGLDIDRSVATPKIVANIVESFPAYSQAKVRAIAFEATLNPDSAFIHLREVVTNRAIPFRNRMSAVTEAAGPLSSQVKSGLYRQLATEPDSTAEQRESAVAAISRIDQAEGRKLCEDLARRRDLRVEDRLRFADRTGRSRALELLREFARDPGEEDAMRIAAARKASSTGTADDRRYLRTLAATPSVAYSLRERLIKELRTADRIAVLGTIADSMAETDEARLAAAIALGALDRDTAATKLRALAEDPGVSNAIRNRATAAERRLA
ncbi:hypothetical protein LZG04_39580 [Saccharothrix sp. S26]|uniref:hypothetical protein n=1 Tax=Saccharothrix sp. S26 TaxID=2907215 RepID=UPI001F3279EB|nr:hypothetical protein [Saccharothrix sp. S26]MCE7000876.1 hypothetical protein [Saccharothrix sp. S26]